MSINCVLDTLQQQREEFLYQLICKLHKRIQDPTIFLNGFPLEQADETCSKLLF